MALNIYLVRHGKTVWNLEGRLQGSGDSPLVEEGIEGAKKAGRALKEVKFAAAYSSMQNVRKIPQIIFWRKITRRIFRTFTISV
ncbi:phosphoglycerate mutase [Actinobacillus equuli]|nr:phosphoglycerate mutase [Actinobacillus equuli]